MSDVRSPDAVTASSEIRWGTQIAVERMSGRSYRMYTERPRRLEHLLAQASVWGDRPHVVQGERILTFADLLTSAGQKAAVLAQNGVKRGNLVFLMAFNSPDYVVNYWAVLKAGAVPVLVNAWWSDAEVADALNLMRPALVMADARALSRIPPGWPTAPWEDEPAEPGQAQTSAPVVGDENDPGVIIFTSGTSGKPKGVVLSHRALLANLHMLLHMTKRLPHQFASQSADIALHTGPLFHIGGAQAMLRAVTVGNTLVMPRGRFDAGETLDLIETWKINRWSAVPTMISRVLDHPGIEERDLASLKAVTLGGAPLHPELQQRIRSGLPGADARIATGYGLSENGGQATAASDSDTVKRPGTSGRPLPLTELKLVERDGLPDGEIFIRAPTQLSEYFGMAESPIDPDGWLATGDLGRLDADGYLWITGRCKDLIIRGGENIAPAAVEQALFSAPGVSDAVVFGLAHPDLGEEVAAIVVLQHGSAEEAVKEHMRSTVASFSVPSWWRFQTEALPVNATGKIDKPALVAEVRATVTTR